ncbi:MAG: spondin domain-containing protein [Gammaproteobacteria bacterium]|nr:spondin domain-containing protein [Gammaproteobacteria bacterium]
MNIKKIITTLGLASAVIALPACNSSNNTVTPAPTPQMYTVTVSNLTQNQPLSPVALIFHGSVYRAWMSAQAASVALEQLAEGGDNSALLADADANADTVLTQSGAGVIPPGGFESVTVTLDQATRMSLVTMLVNTNDAFTGLNTLSLAAMNVDDTLSRAVTAYDAGTELNDELMSNIPGPAAGGEGFNAARNDRVDKVLVHAGVISVDDGLTTSALNESHRFDNPVARITITRTQ